MASPDTAAAGPPIVQYWDDEEIPADVAALMASFAELNPGMRHLVFSEASGARFLAERFGERQAAAFAACAVPAMQADYFRYCAVHALGGVYADADFRCVAPLSSLLDEPGDGILFGRPELPPRWRVPEYERGERVGPYRVVMNSFFAFPAPGHPLLELAIEIATANIERRVVEDVALVTGPAVLTSLYLLRELGSFDAYLAYAEGSVLEAGARLLCETVGRHDRVPRALDGVSMPPEPRTRRWVEGAGAELAYKGGESHWLNVRSSIYR